MRPDFKSAGLDRLVSDKRILILPVATFATGTEAYAYVGLLSSVAQDLDVSIALAGMLAVAYALTFAICSPLLSALTARFDRRLVLLTSLAGITAVNLSAAFAPTFETLIATRVVAGIFSSLVGPAASMAASTLSSDEKRGKALALVLAGMTAAFCIGIPLGSIIGGYAGWRAAFVFAAVVAALAASAILIALPRVPSTDRGGLRTLTAAFDPAIRPIMFQTGLAFAAYFVTINLIGPLTELVTGLQGSGVGFVQAFIGVGSVAGIILGGRVADRPGAMKGVVLIFLVIAGTQAGFSLLALFWPEPSGSAALPLALLAAVGAMGLFAIGPIQQNRLVEAAPKTQTVAFSINGSMVFLGQSFGAVIGSVVVVAWGLAQIGLFGTMIAGLGAIWLYFSSATPSFSAKIPSVGEKRWR